MLTPRVRLAIWIVVVLSVAASPVLWRLVAPWAGAAWQCLCLGGILALYATTPASAIRLPAHASRALILLGFFALPALAMGRITVPLSALTALLLLLDHVGIGDGAGAGPTRVHLSRAPGPTADWVSTVWLWNPALWPALAGSSAAAEPLPATLGSIPVLFAVMIPLWVLPRHTGSLPGGRRRVVMLLILGAVLVAVPVLIAMDPPPG